MKVKNKALLGQLSDMDLRLLQIYKAVVDCGGFSAASLELNIGVSTVSRHIKDLETRLGLVLCQRGRAGFAMTAEGQSVYAEVLRLIQALDTFRASIDDIHWRLDGQLNLALFEKSVHNPNARISQALKAFTEQAPDVSLSVHVRTIQEVERGVIDGSFDVGIIPAHRHCDSLRYTPLFVERMQLYCSADHMLSVEPQADLSWQDLQKHALAGLAYHSPNMQVSQRAGLRRAAHAYDQEGVAALILSGQFIGFLPAHYASTFVDGGRLTAINVHTLHYDAAFFAITRRSPLPNRASKLFNQCLIEAHT